MVTWPHSSPTASPTILHAAIASAWYKYVRNPSGVVVLGAMVVRSGNVSSPAHFDTVRQFSPVSRTITAGRLPSACSALARLKLPYDATRLAYYS
jgi:hypothetical protein